MIAMYLLVWFSSHFIGHGLYYDIVTITKTAASWASWYCMQLHDWIPTSDVQVKLFYGVSKKSTHKEETCYPLSLPLCIPCAGTCWCMNVGG